MLTAATFSIQFSFGQNLVPNPSFEVYSYCPYGFNAFAGNVLNWQLPNSASTDYFNSCDTFLNSTSTPYNVAGFQFPHSGDGYGGIVLFTTQGSYREYIQCQLDSPLHTGINYCLEFYVSLADSAGFAVSNIGAHLSTNPISDSLTNDPLNYSPQIQNPNGNILNDKLNWVKISGCFLASGGESYLTIGNFQVDSLIDTLKMPYAGFGKGNHSYYYIDDAILIEDTSFENIEKIVTPFFTVIPNPVRSSFKIKNYSQNKITSLKLYNCCGVFVQEFKLTADMMYDVSELLDGFYILQILDNKYSKINFKLVIYH